MVESHNGKAIETNERNAKIGLRGGRAHSWAILLWIFFSAFVWFESADSSPNSHKHFQSWLKAFFFCFVRRHIHLHFWRGCSASSMHCIHIGYISNPSVWFNNKWIDEIFKFSLSVSSFFYSNWQFQVSCTIFNV